MVTDPWWPHGPPGLWPAGLRHRLVEANQGRPALPVALQRQMPSFLLLVCSIVSLSFSFIMPTKPRGPEWDNFYRPWKVRCKYCTWEHLGRPAKMQKHLDNRWVTKNPELQSVGGSSSSSSSSLFFSPKSESPSLAEPPLKKKERACFAFKCTGLFQAASKPMLCASLHSQQLQLPHRSMLWKSAFTF